MATKTKSISIAEIEAKELSIAYPDVNYYVIAKKNIKALYAIA